MKESPVLKALEVINDLLNSSSSSDEDDELLTVLSKANLQLRPDIFDDEAINSLSQSDFQQHFHISQESAIYLMDKYSLWYCKSSYRDCNQKPTVNTNVLSFLWFCANAVSFNSVAQKFELSVLDIHDSFNNVLTFIMEELAPELIKLPRTYIEKEAVAKEFEKIVGFPNVLGCLGETYFPVRLQKLAEKCTGSYIHLRGICDANGKFLNVKVGFPETIIDSFIEKNLPKLCFPKYHILGDVKYPIREYLMIPFENNVNLNESDKHYNTMFYETHAKIKKALAVLSSRFQQFKYLDFDNVETMSKFIVGCCILHNICIDRQDFYNGDIEIDVSDCFKNTPFVSINDDEFLTDIGIMKRFELKLIFFKTKR